MRTRPPLVSLLLVLSGAALAHASAVPGFASAAGERSSVVVPAADVLSAPDSGRTSAPSDTAATAGTPGVSARPAASTVSPDSPEIARACRRISPSRLVRVEGSFGTFVGYAGAAGPAGLASLRSTRRNAPAPERTMLTWDQIDLVQTRRSMTGRGALGGAVLVGGALGGIACGTVFIADHIGADVSASDYLGWTGAGIAVGGVIGAFFGAAVGAALPTWRTVYQRR